MIWLQDLWIAELPCDKGHEPLIEREWIGSQPVFETQDSEVEPDGREDRQGD